MPVRNIDESADLLYRAISALDDHRPHQASSLAGVCLEQGTQGPASEKILAAARHIKSASDMAMAYDGPLPPSARACVLADRAEAARLLAFHAVRDPEPRQSPPAELGSTIKPAPLSSPWRGLSTGPDEIRAAYQKAQDLISGEERLSASKGRYGAGRPPGSWSGALDLPTVRFIASGLAMTAFAFGVIFAVELVGRYLSTHWGF